MCLKCINLFFTLLEKEFGEDSFNEIKRTISFEISNKISISNCSSYDNYLLYVFETAFFKYCGVQIEKIPFVIKQMGNDYISVIPFNNLIEIHKNSIDMIIKHLENINTDFI